MAKGRGHLVCVIMTQYVRKSLRDSPLTRLTLCFFSCFYSKRLLHYINYIYYINSQKFWMVISKNLGINAQQWRQNKII